jgi:hypothetical protein
MSVRRKVEDVRRALARSLGVSVRFERDWTGTYVFRKKRSSELVAANDDVIEPKGKPKD